MLPKGKRLRYHLGIIFLLSLVASISTSRIIQAQPINNFAVFKITSSQDIQQLIHFGNQHYQFGQYENAIAAWLQALERQGSKTYTLALHNNLAKAYQQLGNISSAITHRQVVIKVYRQERKYLQLASLLVDQAQAYHSLGQFHNAIRLVEEVLAYDLSGDRKIAVVAQGVLGNTYISIGEYDKAFSAYSQSLQLANAIGNLNYQVTALNNLFQIHQARAERYQQQATAAQREGDDTAQALAALVVRELKAAETTAKTALKRSQPLNNMIRVRALLNKIDLALPDEVNNYQKQAISILKLLPNSQTKAFTLINLANTAAQLDNFQFQAETLNLALQTAKSINDQRTVSFALGALGHLYEKQNRLQEALRVTQQAQLAAQAVNSIDSLYRWEWQAARIYKQQGAKADAIVAYKQAVNSLQQIRNDIAVTNQDFQFDFRDEVEPVYRELMELLLENGSLPEVLQLSELLKLTEVQNYFQDECSQIKTAIDSVNAVFIHSNEAIITSFILKQQSFVVLRLSNGALKSYPIALNAQQMFDNVLSFRYALEDIATNEYLVLSQKLYALLLQPLEADLNQAKTKVLTFVNDGILRNIPMAALYDGKQFLVEKYTIANSLGFNLPRSTSTNTLDRTTIFGLSLASPPLPVLPNVLAEAQAIKDVTAGEEFLNSDFTVSNFKKQVQNGSQVIHVATHGSFGLSAQTTYLQAYDRRIILKELDTIFAQRQEPIELLTLSACETASGDSRATLGLAGIAARNGVKNVLASLWFVNDIAVLPLMEDFYTLIAHSNYSKAQALQAAQIKLIQNQIHPSVWAAFILLHS